MLSFRLGQKTYSFGRHHAQRRMKKAEGGVRLAVKNSEGISSKAGMVESVAGKVSAAAGTGATLAALTGAGAPVAGASLDRAARLCSRT